MSQGRRAGRPAPPGGWVGCGESNDSYYATADLETALNVAELADHYRWLESLRVVASRTPMRTLWPLWPSSAANLVLAGCLVTLSWFVTYRSARNKLVASIFVIVGLLAVLLSSTIGSMVPLFRTGYTGAFILVIGILSLMLLYQGGS